MSSLEHLDLLIGDALERLVEASNEVKAINKINNRSLLMKIGRVVTGLWDVREELYKVKPALKSDLVVEHEKDQKRFEDLDKIRKEAFKMEREGNIASAQELYQQLYDNSRFGHFRLLAEAGLYRCN